MAVEIVHNEKHETERVDQQMSLKKSKSGI